MLLALALACKDPEPPSLAPDTHSWKEEGELVVQGLEDVKRLWKAGNRDASRVLAERVYTERWEPRLEQAARAMGDTSVVELEYAWGVLFVELEGNGRALDDKVRGLEDKTREIADAAARAFPPPAQAGLPAPPPPPAEGSRPIVPDVPPNWESPALPEADG
jgi:hypothetical protein